MFNFGIRTVWVECKGLVVHFTMICGCLLRLDANGHHAGQHLCRKHRHQA